jgi:hypothetical protein
MTGRPWANYSVLTLRKGRQSDETALAKGRLETTHPRLIILLEHLSRI